MGLVGQVLLCLVIRWTCVWISIAHVWHLLFQDRGLETGRSRELAASPAEWCLHLECRRERLKTKKAASPQDWQSKHATLPSFRLREFGLRLLL